MTWIQKEGHVLGLRKYESAKNNNTRILTELWCSVHFFHSASFQGVDHFAGLIIPFVAVSVYEKEKCIISKRQKIDSALTQYFKQNHESHLKY